MDGTTGHPLALIDGEALTLRRTAASSALASTYLSREDARTLVVVGTGALAPYMAEAHCAVRDIARVLVWGRHADRAERTAATLAARGLPAQAVADLEGALAEADIVTCATTAREPVVRGAWVRGGTHVDLVGAFTREMRESDDDLVARAEVFVDTYAGALKEAGDLVQPIDDGAITREHVRAELAQLCARSPCRTHRPRRGHAVQVGRDRARGPVRRAARGRPARLSDIFASRSRATDRAHTGIALAVLASGRAPGIPKRSESEGRPCHRTARLPAWRSSRARAHHPARPPRPCRAFAGARPARPRAPCDGRRSRFGHRAAWRIPVRPAP
jgi:hypothetical protein